MCKKNSIWDRKTRIRKYFSLKNRNIAMIEHVQEKYNITFEEAIDKLLETPSERENAMKELKDYYFDF
ncbi:hypothetical protein PGH07_07850 [Sulfurovum sp. zt1-1]|uniref:Uncharacterized protein n=1 Tax=Sulfurovum zhangzhouensis TaxID=3019067 RepID=A0ABT7QZ30_9BACT|nr:hypothetical protein [Sulfurovum zhangzhouensis]MDM5272090.1 hypothetical protein [Sulfurovum zhangzhouensis]